MSFNLLPLDNEELLNNLPSFNNTLLLIETIKNIPNHSFTCLDRRDNQEDKNDDIDSLVGQIEQDKQEVIIETPIIKQKKTGCTCSKTSCLKRYCECFSSGKICTSECSCFECKNCEEHMELIKQTKAEINSKSVRKTTQGCICKKSHCQKKYCECYNAGIACTEACKCVGCENNTCGHTFEDETEKKNGNKINKREGQPLSTSKLGSSASSSELESISGLNC